MAFTNGAVPSSFVSVWAAWDRNIARSMAPESATGNSTVKRLRLIATPFASTNDRIG